MTDPVSWAAARTGRPVVSSVALTGGMTSTMLRLTHRSGPDLVLRSITEQPWLRHGAELVAREAETQVLLKGTPVPAPVSLALDADGSATGHPAHLMTFLEGDPDTGRSDEAALASMAELLAAIHGVTPDSLPRRFQSWAGEEKWVVPPFAHDAAVWRRAFEVLAVGDPDWEPCFLHRDFGPHNLLWEGDRVSGIVDWVETSTGPAWLDVAHAASNLALRHGTGVASRFASAYAATTGRTPAPYWDVFDVVGFLPAPGGRAFRFGGDWWRRLEDHLARVLADLG